MVNFLLIRLEVVVVVGMCKVQVQVMFFGLVLFFFKVLLYLCFVFGFVDKWKWIKGGMRSVVFWLGVLGKKKFENFWGLL